MTIMKLESQLKIVETAFACIRVRRLVSSAGSSQVIPSQEMPKKLLKTNSMTTAVIPYLSSSTGAPVSSSGVPVETMPARTAMAHDIPIAPKNMRARRPTRSIAGMARRDAMKYSVPLKAEMSRDRLGLKPREFSKM
jgi:hypothetical protein